MRHAQLSHGPRSRSRSGLPAVRHPRPPHIRVGAGGGRETSWRWLMSGSWVHASCVFLALEVEDMLLFVIVGARVCMCVLKWALFKDKTKRLPHRDGIQGRNTLSEIRIPSSSVRSESSHLPGKCKFIRCSSRATTAVRCLFFGQRLASSRIRRI